MGFTPIAAKYYGWKPFWGTLTVNGAAQPK